ncbi:MAG: hypothetical protein ACRDA4_10545 [Filifactoraceae bacterium]
MAVKVINNCKQVEMLIKQGVGKSQREIAIKGVAELKSNSPVVAGATKKSITSKNDNKENNFKTIIGIPDYIYYAEKVELTSRKNKGWFRRTFNRFSETVEDIVRKNLVKILKVGTKL